jgi:hypothetical protein
MSLTIPRPTDPVQGNLIEMDKETRERTPEKHPYHELLRANTGIDDSGPDSHAQGYGQTNAEWSHHS